MPCTIGCSGRATLTSKNRTGVCSAPAERDRPILPRRFAELKAPWVITRPFPDSTKPAIARSVSLPGEGPASSSTRRSKSARVRADSSAGNSQTRTSNRPVSARIRFRMGLVLPPAVLAPPGDDQDPQGIVPGRRPGQTQRKETEGHDLAYPGAVHHDVVFSTRIVCLRPDWSSGWELSREGGHNDSVPPSFGPGPRGRRRVVSPHGPTRPSCHSS